MTTPDRPQVTYFAVSLFSSRTFWVNTAALVITLLSATDVVAIIPARLVPYSTALIASLNIWLRTITVRPVALIAPGTTKPIAVARIDPPPPPTVTD